MKCTRKDLAKLIGFGAVVAFVAVSLIMVGGKQSAPPAASAATQAPVKGPKQAGATAAAAPRVEGDRDSVSTSPAKKSAGPEHNPGAGSSAAEGQAASPRQPTAARSKPLSSASLPPFLPPLRPPPAGFSPSGPPPNVLWLSGVIQGNPKLALLRRGESRYLVREGDTVDGTYRVTRIAATSITLRGSRRTLTLRLGQY